MKTLPLRQKGKKSMEKFDHLLQQATGFFRRKQLRLALDQVKYLQRQPLEPEEKWQVEQLQAACWFGLNELGKAAQAYWQAFTDCCGPVREEQQMLLSNYLFLLHYLPGIRDGELAKQHFLYDRLYAGQAVFSHAPGQAKAKLRIGYLSPDFNEHVDMFFVIQLLACYNRQRYEVYCYSLTEHEDNTTEQVRELADGWRSLGALPPREAAQRIYEDGVDILFDLAAHASGGKTLRVMGYRPAPVQLSGIGYMSTTGMRAVDYFLTDRYCDPEGQNDELFSERLVRLAHTHLCYTPSERVLQCHRTYALHDPVVFGSFNNFSKITDEMLHVWLAILQRVPGSRLLLKSAGTANYKSRQLRERALALGFTEKQLDIRAGSGDYLDAYLDMDIALDTYPYTGGGTTCDALYMGVPVISLYGTRHGTRFGYSLLMNVGLGELAVPDAESYIERAVALAQDKELLLALHQRLRPMLQQSPIMDGRGYTRAVEAAYEQMWAAWVDSKKS